MVGWWVWMNGLELEEFGPRKERSAGRVQRSEHGCERQEFKSGKTDTGTEAQFALHTILITYVYLDVNTPAHRHLPTS